MKKILTLLALVAVACAGFSQAAFVIPSPTNANAEVTLYIDIAQTTGGLKTMLTNHPDYVDSVYMWTWMPAGPVCGNGEWGNSNPCMKLERVSGLLYSITFVPTEFYGVGPLALFQNGISCLAKLDSGYAFPDDGVGEAKTEDLHVDIIPALCSEKWCFFPEVARNDDYLSITYDNNQETDPNLTDLGPNDCYLYIRAKTGTFTFVEYVPAANVTATPELNMKPVPGQDGLFRLTILPEDFFTVPEGQEIQELLMYIVRDGYLPNPPTYEDYETLICE